MSKKKWAAVIVLLYLTVGQLFGAALAAWGLSTIHNILPQLLQALK